MVLPFLKLRQDAQDAISDLPALKAAAERIAAQILHGHHGRKRSGGAESFWQFREYHETDRPQDIDWRQSAKSDQVFIREKELQTPQSVYLWSARYSGMDFASKKALHPKLDAARILSLALAMLYAREDERIGYLGQRAKNGEAAIDALALALLEETNAPLPHAKPISKSKLILCGDFLSPLDEIKKIFETLAARDVNGMIVQIFDPAELSLPYNGRGVFRDHADSQAVQNVDHIGSIRAAYQEKINAHIDAIKALCTSFGWAYYSHVTDTPLEDALMQIWEGEQR